jgi:hypothetical protein
MQVSERDSNQLVNQLVDAITCIDLIFAGSRRKPSMRSFLEWKKRGLIPFRKVGHLVFYDPHEVRAALDKQCRVKASDF